MQRLWGACVSTHDIGQKVAETTVPRVCESHGIDVYGRFANPLDWYATQEKQAMFAEHAPKDDRLGDLQSPGADKVKLGALCFFWPTTVLNTLDWQCPACRKGFLSLC